MVCLPKQFCQIYLINYIVHNPRWITPSGLGSSCFARHYFRNRVFFLFLQVLRCFSSLRSPLIRYFTYVWITRLFSLVEFPHSDIYGSMNICFSPQLFAAYHVLHRLLVSRYPPYALSSLTSFWVFVALQLFSSLIEISFNTSALVYLFVLFYIFFNVLLC